MSDSHDEPPILGMTVDEILNFETAYRDDLFKGKVVLVSGGGTGIGQAIAILFARLGASIVICGRTKGNLDKTQSIIEGMGGSCKSYPMTIRDPEQVNSLMEQVWATHGQLDVLVNNAGGQFPQDAVDYRPKGWHAVIETNLTGTFYMMQAAAKQWRNLEQEGSIVNVVAAFQRGMPQIAHTSAARSAVSNLAQSLAVEWAPYKIRVNCIAPGAIETTGLNVYPEEARVDFDRRNPMRRLGTVMEVAEGVVFLSGPTSGYVTGQTLIADGGQQMWGELWPMKKPEYFE
jgi:citronellol/citronellal dehydrogenase